MYGDVAGSWLAVLPRGPAGYGAPQWNRTGLQSSAWLRGAVTLSAPPEQPFKVVFRAARTPDFDLALDSVSIRLGPCSRTYRQTDGRPPASSTSNPPLPLLRGLASPSSLSGNFLGFLHPHSVPLISGVPGEGGSICPPPPAPVRVVAFLGPEKSDFSAAPNRRAGLTPVRAQPHPLVARRARAGPPHTPPCGVPGRGQHVPCHESVGPQQRG
ncbi:unnamed protein product [Lepidochelys olivacea]